MIRVLYGKNIEKTDTFTKHIENYRRVEVDIGTGDGRFVYLKAKTNTDIFYIGIDPVAENMFEYASKSAQKPAKGGVSNVLYVVAAVEDLPQDLSNVADKIYVTLPWGSLLEGITKGEQLILDNLANITKRNAGFEFLFTYDILREANEIVKRELPILSLDYIKNDLIKKYNANGFTVDKVSSLTEKDLRLFETSWAKRLGFGRSREIFTIKGTIDSKRS